MTTYTFQTLGLSKIGYSGADPFGDPAYPTAAAVGSVLTIDNDAHWSAVSVEDDEAMLHDNDTAPAQTLTAPTTIDGTLYSAGKHVETEHDYIIRIVGSSNPADNIEIHAISMTGVVVGLAATAPLADGASYTIVAQGADSPTVLYSDLVVCFAAGTGILTLRGERVTTADNGPQRPIWIGRQIARGTGRRAPVRNARGVLGARRDLYLSPQHRLLVPDGPDGEALVAAKALLGRPGVELRPRARVAYSHLLLARHEALFADGLAAESFCPGPMAPRALGARGRASLARVLPGLAAGPAGAPARRVLRPAQFGRA